MRKIFEVTIRYRLNVLKCVKKWAISAFFVILIGKTYVIS